MVPAGSMKNPVPERSPCASVPRIFTTALPDFSKISFTSRLIDDVEGTADLGAGAGVVAAARKPKILARAGVTHATSARANPKRNGVAREEKKRRLANRRSL